MRDLFTYGSLMFEPVWRIVVGKSFPFECGVLPGFSIRRMKGEVYPAIVRGTPQDRVNGRIYYGLDKEALRRLDAFEGDCYSREIASILLGERERRCHVYIIKSECRHLLGEEEWTAEWFRSDGLEVFLKGYGGFENMDTGRRIGKETLC
jgi:gamma-glutamylcyclotransferase (GGCT)/AIG2-like uncharacterized protein YtfP